MTTLSVQNNFLISKRRWLWALALAAGIFAASSRSEIAGPSIHGTDKVAHFAVYGLLATLVLRALRGTEGRRSLQAAAWSVVLVSLYGVSDEWHQSFTPGRSVEFADWLSDTVGGALAVALYSGWPRYRGWLEWPVFPLRKRRVENASPTASISSP